MLREPTLSLHPTSLLTQMADDQKDDKPIFVEGRCAGGDTGIVVLNGGFWVDLRDRGVNNRLVLDSFISCHKWIHVGLYIGH